MLVSNYMSDTPVTVRNSDNYAIAFEIMGNSNIHHIPVLDSDDQIVGIVTRRDLELAARYYREAPAEIAEVMHASVITVSANTPLSSAAKLMNESRVGCLPVLADDGNIVGILTETDLFSALIDLLDK